ncbi:FKBP-type peptidyl-prolyl cis-trans isomerase [Paracrocinitomix mangrovi]|uniref:FKBP-type peptidyl-prolyl cis-trans isomerase n=1 Tax=Paracrocinitomix mangrovi TaxID=2862509 RepID=UPI001C8D3112|nr:FKBP-type peptidyl-prolyl cis-trans isomerase [Paracrocinitomix mangrovi]UKN01887.1 FKBP-type peptidyl-prolyl cis-trans isomerase [Paracrocinitomix mangrovi]
MIRTFVFIISIFLLSCKSEPEVQTPVNTGDWTQDESINMHNTFAGEENQEIEDFLSHRPDWKAKETGTGLRYFVYYKSENNDTARAGDFVTVDFEITLLDGTFCYSSEEKGAESFVVEKTDLEYGLHEGIKFMCTGDKAKFILPSHMAHGLIGDKDKIPPLMPTIYDITLVEIQKKDQK